LWPGLTRPKTAGAGRKYQIVAGAQRFRSSKIAGLTTIAVLIRNYTDVQALEVQLIENLKRRDIHPLEESDGFTQLLEQPNYTPEVIAEKIGHPVDYVRKRLQFSKLAREARMSFEVGEINVGHATLLARLPETSQVHAFVELLFDKERDHYDDALGSGSRANRSPGPSRNLTSSSAAGSCSSSPRPLGRKTTRRWCRKAGACTTCPKRSGANALLFDDVKKGDLCLDSACFQTKRTAHLVAIEKTATVAGAPLLRLSMNHYLDNAKKKELGGGMLLSGDYRVARGKGKACENVVQGVFIDGARFGQTTKLCRNGKCKVHFQQFGGSMRDGPRDYWADRARKLAGTIKIKARQATLAAILERPIKWTIPDDQIRVLARALLGGGATEACALLGVKKVRGGYARSTLETMISKSKSAELPKITVALALAPAARDYCQGDEEKRLNQFAAAVGVNFRSIATRTKSELSKSFNEARRKSQPGSRDAGQG
jgi:ParB family chromosome partitioning protein